MRENHSKRVKVEIKCLSHVVKRNIVVLLEPKLTEVVRTDRVYSEWKKNLNISFLPFFSYLSKHFVPFEEK